MIEALLVIRVLQYSNGLGLSRSPMKMTGGEVFFFFFLLCCDIMKGGTVRGVYRDRGLAIERTTVKRDFCQRFGL